MFYLPKGRHKTATESFVLIPLIDYYRFLSPEWPR